MYPFHLGRRKEPATTTTLTGLATFETSSHSIGIHRQPNNEGDDLSIVDLAVAWTPCGASLSCDPIINLNRGVADIRQWLVFVYRGRK
jgi:hypothetical protein